jgi:prepilin-type N-terminal cleavage/methylation domain-containing protein
MYYMLDFQGWIFMRFESVKQKKAFTLIELLVVISIIALLLSLLMPSLGKARNLAMIVTCSGHLKQWGVVTEQYTNDNKDMFWQGHGGVPSPGNDDKKLWMCVMWKYFQNPDFMYCPGAKLPFVAGNDNSTIQGTSDRAWGGTLGLNWLGMPRPGVRDKNGEMAMWHPKGSYGENSWVANKTGGDYTGDNRYWRSRNIKGSNKVLMLGDSAWLDAWPVQSDTPPPYKDISGVLAGNSMWRVCIDRHKGNVVWVFVDSSVRPVGIKELFTQIWHRGYKPEGCPYTWRYYAGNGNPSGLWPDWMKGFKEYMDK